MRRLMFIIAVAGLALIGSSPPTRAESGPVWGWAWNDYGQVGDASFTMRASPVKLIRQPEGVIAVSAGGVHSLALKSNGTVVSWGSNWNGRLGDGTTTDQLIPVPVVGLTDVVAVEASKGGGHSLAIKSDGTVWAWGANAYGQLGDGSTSDRVTPIQVPGLSGITKVAAGIAHSLALSSDGTLYAWGWNYCGQLGDGTTTDRLAPVPVSGLAGTPTQIAAPGHYSMALLSDGTVKTWGYNDHGQLGDGTTTWRSSPVSASGLSGVTALGGGQYFGMALLGDRSVRTWGWNANGQLGDGTTTQRLTPVAVVGLTGIVSVAGGETFGLALTQTGRCYAWGGNADGALGNGTTTSSLVPELVPDVTRVAALSAGPYHCLVSKTNGTAWTWGDNAYGQIGNGTRPEDMLKAYQVGSFTDVVQICGGFYHSVALKSDGTVWAWGDNATYGQLGNGTGWNSFVPVKVPGLSGILGLSSSAHHSLAIQADRTLVAWGWNANGQIGDGTTTNRPTPTPVTGLTEVIGVSAQYTHSIAVRSDGTVWTWGANGKGQLGDGTTTERTTPVQVVDPSDPSGYLTGVTAVAGGYFMSYALKADGSVWSWGDNQFGSLGIGTKVDSLVPIQVAGLPACRAIVSNNWNVWATTTANAVWGWGPNWGTLGDGTGDERLSPVALPGLTDIAVVGGPQTGGMALKSDGTVLAWGSGQQGQLGDGRFDSWALSPQPIAGLSRASLVAGGLYHAFAAGRPNTEPVADEQIADALPNVGNDITLTGSDGDGDVLTYTIVQTPAHGTLTGTPPNVTYTSIGEFGGPDTFQFTVDDGDLESEPATVTVNVARSDSKTNGLDRTGVGASTVALRGYLYKKSNSAPLSGRTLEFSVAGTLVGTATTGSSGSATLNWVIDAGPATRAIRVEFAGDASYNPSFALNTLTVLTYDTVLLVPNRSGEIGESVNLRGYLYRASPNLAVAGKTLAFKVDGTAVGTAATNSLGRAMLSWPVPEALNPGAHTLSVEWPGDAGYRPSSGSARLDVAKGVTYLWALSRSMSRGTSAYLRGYLRRLPDYVWLVGKDVTISVDGTVVGSAPTDAGGKASVLYAAPSGMTTGDHTIGALFAGDDLYLQSGATALLTVTP